MTTGELLVSAWAPGFVVPMTCTLAIAWYGIRYRARLAPRSSLFGLGVLLFFLALASPIGVLARGYLFSAHMLQHLLLMLAVPPLLLLGLPPSDESPPAVVERRSTAVASWAGGVGAMWIWHLRTLCNAAAEHASVQAVQTVSLVVLGLAFWRPIVSPRASERMETLHAVAYLFTACVACTILGVIVTLSPIEVCTAYMNPVDELGALPLLREGWGVTCKADQEIGGLMMWVPTCFVYAGAILAKLGRYYADERTDPTAIRSTP